MKKILLATTSKSKLRPFKLAWEEAMFDKKYDLITLNDMDNDDFEVEEDTGDFETDALKKAQEYSKHYNIPTIALDRGITFEAFNGWPGTETKFVFTPPSKYVFNVDPLKDENIPGFDLDVEMTQKVLDKLKGKDRTMHSVYGIAFSFPDGKSISDTISYKGVAAERLNVTKRGYYYDWFFIPNGYKETFSSMSETEYLKFASTKLWGFPKKIQEYILSFY